jgi:malonate decarboxylase acyl carrier protein
MALQEIIVSYRQKPGYIKLPVDWSHSGIVSSGDMEALVRRKDLDGELRFRVVTPLRGFDEVWKKVLLKFAEESNLGDAEVTINDNNATPFVVAARLRQMLTEAQDKAQGGE